ncbi:MAG: helix-turn-helix transcriptional regulator [Chitinophagales bacterium]
MYLSNNIRYFRKKLGLNQIAFADLIGAKRNTISDYERGRSNPSIELIRKMAELFKTNLDDLIEKDMSQFSTEKLSVEALKVNKLEEEGATYYSKVINELDENILAEVSEQNRLKIKLYIDHLQMNIQQLKQQNESKDTEIYYLKNLIAAKEQTIQNLKRLIDFLEKQVKN